MSDAEFYVGIRSSNQLPHGHGGPLAVGVRGPHGQRTLRALPTAPAPDAFEWGYYEGRGPLELAEAILHDVLGCEASMRDAHDFMQQIVSELPRDEFELPKEQVTEWLLARRRASTREIDLFAVAWAAYGGEHVPGTLPVREHLEAVARAVSRDAWPIAFFHDVLEDGVLSRAVLDVLLDPHELAAVEILTRRDHVTYAEYIDTVCAASGIAGEMAREVKIADVRHNLSRLTPERESLRPRYENALQKLTARGGGNAPPSQ